jgi:hypothetical protein
VSPTGDDIENSLEAALASVSGSWSGQSYGTNPITFQFTLQEQSGGRVQGTGSMKEQQAATAVPITLSGTFQQPALSLTFDGMVYEGQPVQGTLRSNYVSVAGVGDSLQLSGQNYSKKVLVLLQEAQ